MDSRDYRNLLVWARGRSLAAEVHRIMAKPPFRREWVLRDQMRRAAISVPSNIAEGNERGSDRDGARFFYYARGSLAELATQTYIAHDVGLLDEEQARAWVQECDDLARMLAALIRSRFPS